ncbi:MAG: FAD-dependent oxidoreductase, partial [Actinomycetes bacterium]
VRLHLTAERPYGVLAMAAKRADDATFDDHIPEEESQPLTDWNARALRRRGFALTLTPETHAYRPERVVDGLQRPFGGPHLWSSAPVRLGPEWVELAWDQPVRIASVRLVFNDDVDEDLINLHHHRTPFPVMPELVADYRIEVRTGGTWVTVADVGDNRHRHRVHDIDPVTADALRLVVTRTNGSPYVTVCAIKAYAEPSTRSPALPWR